MKLAYTRKGRGPVLVLVHGYLGGGKIWADQLAAFSVRHDVICPDLAGFGDSAHLTAPDSITGHAQDVLRLLDALGVETFALLGHSMGGMVVQEMVRLAPDRIPTLVLYGTGPQGVLPGRFETIAPEDRHGGACRFCQAHRGDMVHARRGGRGLSALFGAGRNGDRAGGTCQPDRLGKLGWPPGSGTDPRPDACALGQP